MFEKWRRKREAERLRKKETEYRRMLIRVRDEKLDFYDGIDRDIFALLYLNGGDTE